MRTRGLAVACGLGLGLAGVWLVLGGMSRPHPASGREQEPRATPAAAAPSRAVPAAPGLAKFLAPKGGAARQAAAARPIDDQALRDLSDELLCRLDEVRRATAGHPRQPWRGQPRASGSQVPNPDQQRAIDDVLARLGPETVLHMDNLSGTLRHLRSDLSPLVADDAAYAAAAAAGDAGAMALATVAQLQPVMRIQQPGQEFVPAGVTCDDLGMTHVVLQQTYAGAPLWGAQVRVHFSADDRPVEVSGVYAATPTRMPVAEREIAEDEAVSRATAVIPANERAGGVHGVQRMVYWDLDQPAVMCYRVDLRPSGEREWQVFIATADGRVVHRYDALVSAAATGSAPDYDGVTRSFPCWQDGANYYAINTTLPFYDATSTPPDFAQTKGAIFIIDAQNQEPTQEFNWPYVKSTSLTAWDPAAVVAMRNLGLVATYYRQTHQRNTPDDKAMNIVGAVHVGQGMDNAYWSSSYNMMFFGDGSGQSFRNLPKGLDVVGHEFTHGVVSFTANLIYENQYGAMNEHLADFFGAMVDREDWLMGEDIVAQAGKIALRDMQNPANPNVIDQLPTRMSEYRNLPVDQDHGGVHINCGILNRMSYLLCDGPQGIGRDKAEKIAYRCLANYLTQRSQFIDFRRGMLSAAKDLHGDGSPEVAAVGAAFDAVEITDAPATPPPTPAPTGTGTDQIAFLVADNWWYDPGTDSPYLLYLNSGGVNSLVTTRYVANTRPAVSGDGKWALFLDQSNNIWWTDGSSEQQWTTSGLVRTLTMSKDQRYIAFTTTDFRSSIFVLNTQTSESAEVALLVPQPDGTPREVDYADVLSFTFTGDYLAFDGVAQARLQGGDTVAVWGVYEMRMADLACQQLIPQAPGEQIGNPTYSHTRDYRLVADQIVTDGTQVQRNMLAIDLQNRAVGVLAPDVAVLGQSSYQGSDAGIAFRFYNSGTGVYSLASAGLAADGLSLANGTVQELAQSYVPIVFPVGLRELPGGYVAPRGTVSVAAALPFGDVVAGQQKVLNLVVANTGNADLDVYQLTIGGADKSDFAHNAQPKTIPPGQNLVVPVAFGPLRTGAHTATFEIKSTDPAAPATTVTLTGTGAEPPNVPPSVSIASPAPTDAFTAPATVTIEATANDTDGTVAKVEFFQGDTKLGEDLVAPYSCAWTGVAAGAYVLTARATDDDGAATTSAAVNITVATAAVPLTLAGVSPGAGTGTQVTVTDAVPVAENATQAFTVTPGGGVTPYHFAWTLGGAAAGADSATFQFSPGYEAVGHPLASVDRVLTCTVTDSGGRATVTATWQAVRIQDTDRPTPAPTVSIAPVSPVAGQDLTASVTAQPADPDGDTLLGHVFAWRLVGSQNSLAGSTLPGQNTFNGQQWQASAKPRTNPYGTGEVVAETGGTATVTIANVRPSVALVLPLPAATFFDIDPILLRATAEDDRAIARVEFLADGGKIGEDTTAPYEFTWTGAAPGAHALTARAFDDSGDSTLSTAVSITVTDAGGDDADGDGLPDNWEVATFGDLRYGGEDDADGDGRTNREEFLAQTDPLGYVVSLKKGWNLFAPTGVIRPNGVSDIFGAGEASLILGHAWAWDAALGAYRPRTVFDPLVACWVYAKADADLTLHVTTGGGRPAAGSNAAPTVALTAPAPGAALTAPVTLEIAATAADTDGQVTRVEFLSGGVWLGEDATAPYTFTWLNVPAGTYTLTARATDNTGASTTSAPVTATVSTPVGNAAPGVTLTAPAPGQTFTAPATITLTAAATDTDGTIAKVEFFRDGVKVGEDLSEPYTLACPDVAAGTYQLTARATDNGGAATTSAATTVTVNAVAADNPGLTYQQTFSTASDVAQFGTSAVEGLAQAVLASQLNGNQLTLTGTLTQTAANTQSFSYSSQPTDRLRVVLVGAYALVAKIASFDGYLQGDWTGLRDSHTIAFDFTTEAPGAPSLHVESSAGWFQGRESYVRWQRHITGTAPHAGEVVTVNLTHSGTRSGYVEYPYTMWTYNEQCTGTVVSPSAAITVSEAYWSTYGLDAKIEQHAFNRSISNNSSATVGGHTYAFNNAYVKWEYVSQYSGEVFVNMVRQPDYWQVAGTLSKDGQVIGAVQFDGEVSANTHGPDLVLHLNAGENVPLHPLVTYP